MRPEPPVSTPNDDRPAPDLPQAQAAVLPPVAAPGPRRTWREQLGSNWLALLSLAIALFGLAYNTYRNETTERQRNVRDAGFIVLDALGELQQLADARFFGGDRSEANRIAIWGRVVLVRDVSELVSNPAKRRADALYETWSARAAAFDQGDREAERAVAEVVRAARGQVLADLRALK